MKFDAMRGGFVVDGAQTWYRIDDIDHRAPFFMALAGDSDLWAFVSTAGSLAAGRRDPEGSFLPYETVDKIHRRWQHTGPRTWIRLLDGARAERTRPSSAAVDHSCSKTSRPEACASRRRNRVPDRFFHTERRPVTPDIRGAKGSHSSVTPPSMMRIQVRGPVCSQRRWILSTVS